MTVSAGTTVGWFKTNSAPYTIRIWEKQTLTFDGRVDAPDYFVRANTTQEGNGQWVGGGIGIAGSTNETSGDVTRASEIRMNFTTMAAIWGPDQQFRDYQGYLIVRGNNSVLAGGNTVGYVISYDLTNCLVDCQQIGQVKGSPGNEVYLLNCTLHNGNFYSQRQTAIPVSATNCAFDGVSLSVSDGTSYPTYTRYDYNAYTNATDPFPIGGSHDKNSVSFNWQSGPLGRFYLPTNSVLMINVGNTNVSVR
jgi:hypothetical protein